MSTPATLRPDRRDRDYMRDADVETVGDAMAKMDAEVRAEYEAAGAPLGYLTANGMLAWSLEARR